jgi:hypothetical protein
MAKKYQKHDTDEGKFMSTIDDYGHGEGNGKSRQAVSKHYDKVVDTQGDTVVEAVREVKQFTVPLSDEAMHEKAPPISDEADTSSDWLNVEFDMTDEQEQIASIPAPIRGLIGTLSGQADPDAVKTPAQLRVWYQQQARLVRYFLAGVVDPAFSWWAKGITANPEFKIERSHSEWEMTEAVTEQFLQHNGISVMVNPNLLMAGMMGALYAPQAVRVVKERDPNRKSAIGGIFQRWKQRRAVRKALKENPHLTRDDLEMD